MSHASLGNYTCPGCDTKLENVQTKYGVVWSCFNCKGRALGIGLLKKVSNPELIQQVWMRAKQESNSTGVACPSCRRSMLVVTTVPQLGSVELDVCPACFFIWFDNEELDKIPKATDAEIAKRADANGLKIRPPSTLERYNRSDYDDDGGLFDIADLLESWIRWR